MLPPHGSKSKILRDSVRDYRGAEWKAKWWMIAKVCETKILKIDKLNFQKKKHKRLHIIKRLPPHNKFKL